MPTTNPTITETWSLVAGGTVTSVLISISAGGAIEIATTASDATAPTIAGHRLGPGDGVTRDTIGDGAIWARAIPVMIDGAASALLVVTA